MRVDARLAVVLLATALGCGSSSSNNSGTDSGTGGGQDSGYNGPDGSADSTVPDAGDAGRPTDGGDSGGPLLDGGFNGAVFYVTNDDGTLYAFQVGSWTQIGKWTGLPLTDGVRGIDADPVSGILYIAHGGDDLTSNGHLLAWSLTQNRTVYDKALGHGIDQLAFGGGRIYMPAGELAATTTWYVLSAQDGSQVGTETGGSYPHNTIYLNGHHYYGGRQSDSLVVAGIGAGAGTIGPTPSAQTGVRPFTVNAAETRVWITWTAYRGFSIGDVLTGALVTSVNFGPVPNSYTPTAASHGISLSPSGSELYVLDTPLNTVRVYDGTDNPQLLATIPFQHNIYPGNENPCAYDCPKDGWILHSRDGKYVYIGDSGDVVDTASRTVAGFIPPLQNDRHGFIEIEWSGGVPTGTTTHFGRSY